MPQTGEKAYRWACAFLGAVLLGVLPLFSQDSGIPYDEAIHNEHGKILYSYFKGESQEALRPPTRPNGELITADTEWTGSTQGMNFFGGGFDLLSRAAYENGLNRFFGEIEARHLLVSLFAVLCVFATGAMAGQVAGWRAAFFAMLLLACSPRFLGHAWNNPKDLPFASLYALSGFLLLFLARRARVGWGRRDLFLGAALVVSIGFAQNIRIIGGLLSFYVLLFSTLIPGKEGLKARWKNGTAALAIAAGAYGVMLLYWPYARLYPLSAPLAVLRTAASTWSEQFNVLFEGSWAKGEAMPWYYHLKWILVSSPLFLPLGMLAHLFKPMVRTREFFWLVTMGVVPLLLSFFSGRTVRHDEWRHFLFLYPVLSCLAAIGWDHLLEASRSRWVRGGATLLLLVFVAEPLYFVFKNHPHEGVYFSPAIGGVSKAYRDYETEAYGTSLRAAVEWIAAYSGNEPQENLPIRIRVPYGHALSAKYFIQRFPKLKFVRVADDSLDWDFSILMPQAARNDPSIRENWPPAGTVHQIRANEAPLCAISRNTRLDGLREAKRRLQQEIQTGGATSENYRILARVLMEFAEYDSAKEAARNSLAREPKQTEPWLLIAQAETRRGRLEEAVAVLKSAERNGNPSAELRQALGELLKTQAQIKEAKDPLARGELYLRTYQFSEAEKSFREVLQKQPDQIQALLGLAQTYLKQRRWREALDISTQALSLDPRSYSASYLRFWASGNL